MLIVMVLWNKDCLCRSDNNSFEKKLSDTYTFLMDKSANNILVFAWFPDKITKWSVEQESIEPLTSEICYIRRQCVYVLNEL